MNIAPNGVGGAIEFVECPEVDGYEVQEEKDRSRRIDLFRATAGDGFSVRTAAAVVAGQARLSHGGLRQRGRLFRRRRGSVGRLRMRSNNSRRRSKRGNGPTRLSSHKV